VGGNQFREQIGPNKNSGSVLIVSLLFMLIVSALTFSTATLSGTNMQLAENQLKADSARACAESGLEVVRFWLNRVSISDNIEPGQRLNQIANSIQNDLSANNITNITYNYDGATINIPNVIINSALNKYFSATISQIDNDTLQIDVTGTYDSITRTIRVYYNYGTRGNALFDFGIASKGPLSLSGNIELEGVNESAESNAYIESESSILALSITGNSKIAGNVKIVNPLSTVDLQGGNAGIGGETGQEAIENHVEFGVLPAGFPEPNPKQFESYAVNIVDSNTDTSSDATFENIKILAETNPTFSGHVTIKGIVFIKTPNIVTFTGTADITGIIAGDGDWTDDSATNQINFLGNVESFPVNELPLEENFVEIRNETGTFIIAPGFSVSFGGSFTTLCGAIAANGIKFHGRAGGIINGSIINYSNEQMCLSGNNDLYFNPPCIENAPAGFKPVTILRYDPASYSEVTL
jgi:Tfp pilus assembly protein PilX